MDLVKDYLYYVINGIGYYCVCDDLCKGWGFGGGWFIIEINLVYL